MICQLSCMNLYANHRYNCFLHTSGLKNVTSHARIYRFKIPTVPGYKDLKRCHRSRAMGSDGIVCRNMIWPSKKYTQADFFLFEPVWCAERPKKRLNHGGCAKCRFAERSNLPIWDKSIYRRVGSHQTALQNADLGSEAFRQNRTRLQAPIAWAFFSVCLHEISEHISKI